VGNLMERSLSEMINDPMMERFGKAKAETLPRACRRCDVLSACNGGCPKDRFCDAPDGTPGLSYLCPAYRRFFRHSRPGLYRLAQHMKLGRPLRAFDGKAALAACP